MNTLMILIDLFKQKNVYSICYNYTKLDRDIAISKYVDHQMDGTLPENATDSKYYLRSQDYIFPVKTSNELTWLCGLLFLFDMKNLLDLFNELISINDPFILILNGSTYIDNDKLLAWVIDNGRFNIYYQGNTQKINLKNPTNKSYNKDAIVMAIGHFIYINVLQGRL